MTDLDMNQIIHAAVRRDLARAETALRALDDGDAKRAADIQRAWGFLWSELQRHHEGEDAHIWPYLRRLGAVDPAVVDAMESEHHDMGAACTSATSVVDTVASAPTKANATAAADAVAEAARITCAHLDHEEAAITPFIKDRAETAEWKAVEKELRKASPTTAGRFFAWIQDGASPEAQTALRSIIPGPVLLILDRGLGRSYHRSIAPVWR